jgi:hypothetical protein
MRLHSSTALLPRMATGDRLNSVRHKPKSYKLLVHHVAAQQTSGSAGGACNVAAAAAEVLSSPRGEPTLVPRCAAEVWKN